MFSSSSEKEFQSLHLSLLNMGFVYHNRDQVYIYDEILNEESDATVYLIREEVTNFKSMIAYFGGLSFKSKKQSHKMAYQSMAQQLMVDYARHEKKSVLKAVPVVKAII